MKARTEVQALADQLQGYITAVGDLAVAVREDLAFEGSEPGPRLTGDQVDAINLAIITMAKLAGEDLIGLLGKLGVPA
ncbi:hypothetical protein [Pseudomonas sp. 273]|uniref:hypothetical protein n=1 Tax=Pseudomonas sp. 273 TaxID=75692 RepID=UPI0023D83B50|nr:hypothetical protein [Pseudomonas sp. 273]